MLRLEGCNIVGEERLDGRHRLVDAEFATLDIMMNVDDVEMATGTLAHETLQEAQAGGTTSVGDGWRGNGDLTCEGLNESFVYIGRLGRG